MTDTPGDYLDQLGSACTALKLASPPDEQDWGWLNADPDRVDEFIRYYSAQPHDELDPAFEDDLLDLVFMSVARFMERENAPVPPSAFLNLLTLFAPRDAVRLQLSFWSQDLGEFPHLRKWMTSQVESG